MQQELPQQAAGAQPLGQLHQQSLVLAMEESQAFMAMYEEWFKDPDLIQYKIDGRSGSQGPSDSGLWHPSLSPPPPLLLLSPRNALLSAGLNTALSSPNWQLPSPASDVPGLLVARSDLGLTASKVQGLSDPALPAASASASQQAPAHQTLPDMPDALGQTSKDGPAAATAPTPAAILLLQPCHQQPASTAPPAPAATQQPDQHQQHCPSTGQGSNGLCCAAVGPATNGAQPDSLQSTTIMHTTCCKPASNAGSSGPCGKSSSDGQPRAAGEGGRKSTDSGSKLITGPPTPEQPTSPAPPLLQPPPPAQEVEHAQQQPPTVNCQMMDVDTHSLSSQLQPRTSHTSHGSQPPPPAHHHQPFPAAVDAQCDQLNRQVAEQGLFGVEQLAQAAVTAAGLPCRSEITNVSSQTLAPLAAATLPGLAQLAAANHLPTVTRRYLSRAESPTSGLSPGRPSNGCQVSSAGQQPTAAPQPPAAQPPGSWVAPALVQLPASFKPIVVRPAAPAGPTKQLNAQPPQPPYLLPSYPPNPPASHGSPNRQVQLLQRLPPGQPNHPQYNRQPPALNPPNCQPPPQQQQQLHHQSPNRPTNYPSRDSAGPAADGQPCSVAHPMPPVSRAGSAMIRPATYTSPQRPVQLPPRYQPTFHQPAAQQHTTQQEQQQLYALQQQQRQGMARGEGQGSRVHVQSHVQSHVQQQQSELVEVQGGDMCQAPCAAHQHVESRPVFQVTEQDQQGTMAAEPHQAPALPPAAPALAAAPTMANPGPNIWPQSAQQQPAASAGPSTAAAAQPAGLHQPVILPAAQLPADQQHTCTDRMQTEQGCSRPAGASQASRAAVSVSAPGGCPVGAIHAGSFNAQLGAGTGAGAGHGMHAHASVGGGAAGRLLVKPPTAAVPAAPVPASLLPPGLSAELINIKMQQGQASTTYPMPHAPYHNQHQHQSGLLAPGVCAPAAPQQPASTAPAYPYAASQENGQVHGGALEDERVQQGQAYVSNSPHARAWPEPVAAWQQQQQHPQHAVHRHAVPYQQHVFVYPQPPFNESEEPNDWQAAYPDTLPSQGYTLLHQGPHGQQGYWRAPVPCAGQEQQGYWRAPVPCAGQEQQVHQDMEVEMQGCPVQLAYYPPPGSYDPHDAPYEQQQQLYELQHVQVQGYGLPAAQPLCYDLPHQQLYHQVCAGEAQQHGMPGYPPAATDMQGLLPPGYRLLPLYEGQQDQHQQPHHQHQQVVHYEYSQQYQEQYQEQQQDLYSPYLEPHPALPLVYQPTAGAYLPAPAPTHVLSRGHQPGTQLLPVGHLQSPPGYRLQMIRPRADGLTHMHTARDVTWGPAPGGGGGMVQLVPYSPGCDVAYPPQPPAQPSPVQAIPSFRSRAAGSRRMVVEEAQWQEQMHVQGGGAMMMMVVAPAQQPLGGGGGGGGSSSMSEPGVYQRARNIIGRTAPAPPPASAGGAVSARGQLQPRALYMHTHSYNNSNRCEAGDDEGMYAEPGWGAPGQVAAQIGAGRSMQLVAPASCASPTVRQQQQLLKYPPICQQQQDEQQHRGSQQPVMAEPGDAGASTEAGVAGQAARQQEAGEAGQQQQQTGQQRKRLCPAPEQQGQQEQLEGEQQQQWELTSSEAGGGGAGGAGRGVWVSPGRPVPGLLSASPQQPHKRIMRTQHAQHADPGQQQQGWQPILRPQPQSAPPARGRALDATAATPDVVLSPTYSLPGPVRLQPCFHYQPTPHRLTLASPQQPACPPHQPAAADHPTACLPSPPTRSS